MKSDEQIVEELRLASEGLMMMSESDYPFEVVCREQTPLSTDDSLRRIIEQPATASVRTESVEEFFRPAMTAHAGQREEERRTVEKYRGLVEALQTNLQDVRVYKVGEINIRVLIVGRAPSGSWLGLSTRVVET